MARFYLIGFACLLFFDTLGQTGFKFSALEARPLEYSLAWIMRILSNKWIYITTLSYAGAFFSWMILLKKAPVGPAFAASRTQIVTVMLISVFIFNETLTLARCLGAGLIIAGIICLAFAEKKLAEKNKSAIS
ncbi:multidrug transporter EmrE-like cation transporter [Orbus hercynius]|uniref:Multidrug transporter EmrE-like cation transporter n=1 Tax=Orbus hercynius TaxID=593135 RepID=A0A495RHG4_9GAMM|nr:EamA family transporter [Orbus hercynius]RKS86869.1 multidrug transporter EmrE-like cation transporter [Orbus hercynius]